MPAARESVKIETYNCRNFDRQSGQYLDYDNRPEICKNTNCVDKNSSESIDAQREKFIGQKFIKIK